MGQVQPVWARLLRKLWQPEEGGREAPPKLREGDIERGVPVTPQVGRLKFEEAAEALLTDYVVNRRRSHMTTSNGVWTWD